MKIKLSGLFFLFSLFLFSQTCMAKSKDVEVGFNTREMYDNNIFYNNLNKRSDFVTSLEPTIAVNHKLKRVRFSADAEPQFLSYAKNSDINATNYNVNEKIEADINSHLKASVSNSNVKDTVSYLVNDLVNNVGSTGRFGFESNSISPTLTYNSKHGTALTGSYSFDRVSYHLPELSDNEGHNLSASLVQKITNLISALMDITFQSRHFDNGFEAGVLLFDWGARWAPGIRWVHDFKMGLQRIDKTDSRSDSQFYYTYTVSYFLTRLTSLSYTSQLSSSIIATQNNVLRIWQNSIGASQKLSRSDSLNVSVTYVWADVVPIKAKSTILKLDTDIEHALSKYAALKIGYSYENQSSDLSAAYKRDTTYISLNLKY